MLQLIQIKDKKLGNQFRNTISIDYESCVYIFTFISPVNSILSANPDVNGVAFIC